MIQITDTIVLDDLEIKEHFVRATGPGGQNVNKDATAVELRVDIGRSSLPPAEGVKKTMTDLRRRFPPDLQYRYSIDTTLPVSGSSWTMDGSLTIRGVTRIVPLRFTFNGTAPSQSGQPARVAFHGSAATKRADFGMMRDLLEELGASPAPGPDVEIEIDAEALAKRPRLVGTPAPQTPTGAQP
jgi:hypothetical protein